MKIIRYADSTGAVHHAAQSGREWVRIEGDLLGRWSLTDRPVKPETLLAPVVPTVVLCIGLNYRPHVAETGACLPDRPVLFMKSPGAVQDPFRPIRIPTRPASHKVDYEGELAVVIGSPCLNATRATALQHVLGYTCGNDVSARDWQKEWGGGQWCRGKTFDTFLPLGPCLVTPEALPDPNRLDLRTRVNGEIRQEANTREMIFDVRELIVFLSGGTTLLPGTVILTGTPEGVGMARTPPAFLAPGDEVCVEIDEIGELVNPVEAD